MQNFLPVIFLLLGEGKVTENERTDVSVNI